MNPIEDGRAPLSLSEERAARRATLLVFLLSGAGFANWVVRIPAVKTQLGLSESELGLALFGVAVGAVCVLPIVPLWLERSGSRKVIGVLRGYDVRLGLTEVSPCWAETDFFGLGIPEYCSG